jgi:hypothetical protein
METQVVETLELIANRVKGRNDTWILVGDTKKIVHPSLTDALEAWFDKNQEQVEFRLAPLDSKLYVIRTEEKAIEPEPVKRYNLYGDAI